jgi:hypothetical protein
LGFRESEFEWVKGKGTYRIAVIGDSFTFGQGIPQQDRFTDLLGRLLDGKTARYEVLNFGKPGAETVDHVVILRDVALRTKPDFILLQWYVNDVEGHNKQDRPVILPLLPSSRLHARFHASSALYFLMNRQWGVLQSTLGISSGTKREYMLKRFGDPNSPASREASQALKDFIDLCAKNQIPMGVVLFPYAGIDLGDSYPYAFLHERVREICTEREIQSLDLRPRFAPYTKHKKLWANRFDSHPSAFAHRLAAEALMETFGPAWGADSAN